jgi:signal transduction histidine kinase
VGVVAASGASEELAERLEKRRTIGSFARMAVPAFADCCMINVVEKGGKLRRLHVVCADPAKQAIMDELAGRYLPCPDRPAELAPAVGTSASRLFADIPERFWETIAEDPEHLRRLRALGFRSMIVVPIVVRKHVLATVCFLTGESGRRYGANDLQLAEALAHEAGLTIDNARLQHFGRVAAAAEAANRTKDEFLAMLSHEMRSPLGAIKLWASLLRIGKLPAEKATHAIEAIERNAAVLSRFIEELMDVSRIVAGKLVLDVRSVDLGAVVDSAFDTVQAAADAKGIQLDKQIDSSGQVPGDSTRLQQVISNLLSNAVKFSNRDAHVLLRIAAEETHAVISVRDAGEGIASEFLPHVFERFRQASTPGARAHGGLGLGLAIVREIVELHHGTVNAESAGRGQGSTFTVTLPFIEGAGALRIGGPNAGAAVPAARVGKMLDGVRVLIVEADPDVRSALVLALELSGARVTTAASAAEALECMREHLDVLVSAIAPGEDGYALIRRIRSLSPLRGGRVPAAALTGSVAFPEVDRILSAGYQMHLTKPVDSSALVAAVAKLAAR